jgi:O-antigen/teichoic acid export membrane protein
MRFHKLIAQNIIWRGLYYFSQFILNILISRYLKADGSGEIYYLINNLSLLLLVIGVCFESGATYYIAKNEIKGNKIAFFLLVWTLLATALCIMVFKWIPANSGHLVDLGKYIPAYCLYVSGILFITYFSSLFFAKHNFFIANFILFCSNILVIFLLLLYGENQFVKEHFTYIYFASFFLQGFVTVAVYFFYNPPKIKSALLSASEFRKVFHYSVMALLANVIFFLVYRVDYWFVKRFCSENDLGNYIQVSKLGQMFFVLPSIISSTIFPVIASGEQQVKSTLKAISVFLAGIYFFICVTLIASGKWLFPHIYGISFDNMYLPFIFSVPGILALSSLYPFTAYYSGKKRIDINIKGLLIALFFIIAGDFIIIPRFGITGAAFVSSVGYIIYQVYIMMIFAKDYNVSFTSMFLVSSAEIKKIYSAVKQNIINISQNE